MMFSSHNKNKLKSAAKNILDKIFCEDAVGELTPDKNSTQELLSFYIIPGNDGPRWIVPIEPQSGKNVLKQWRPYGRVSKIKWLVIRFLYICKSLYLVPNVEKVSVKKTNVTSLIHQEKALSPVCYIGTAGPQQKSVVTWVDSASGQPVSIMKVGLRDNANYSIVKEADVLNYLAQHNVKNSPKLLQVYKEKNISFQTYLDGLLSDRKLTITHISTLSELPKGQDYSSNSEQIKALEHLMAENQTQFTPIQKSVLTNAIQDVANDNKITLTLVHGDFAPWNIKLTRRGLALIDWEDADINGLPCWDLCHFCFIQSHLFEEALTIANFLNNDLTKLYAKLMKIEQKNIESFVILYFLYMVIDHSRNTSKAYRAFLMQYLEERYT